jgi:hypothetical protein
MRAMVQWIESRLSHRHISISVATTAGAAILKRLMREVPSGCYLNLSEELQRFAVVAVVAVLRWVAFDGNFVQLLVILLDLL